MFHYLAANTQLLIVVFSALVPLPMYVLNHYAPWVSEPIKGIVQAVFAAGVGAVVLALGRGDFGWNYQLLDAVVTAMIAAYVAHTAYRSAGINVRLGGGSNANRRHDQA